MTQATNPSIATGQTGTAYRTQDNDRYAAALTQHSGSSRPTYAVTGTLWLDTTGTPWILKMYDGADDISVGTVNASTNAFNASNAASTSSTIAMTAAINEAGATVASASTCDIGAAGGNYVSVTGVTTITALGTVQVGTRRTVRFAGILTLTHNGTSLILPGAANITTAAGDVATFISLGSGNWFCVEYTRAASMAAYVGLVQSWTAAQGGTITTDNDGSFDLSVTNDFFCTPTGSVALTFTNHRAQKGDILFVNGSNYAVTAAATTKINSADLTTLSATGTYRISYMDNGTNAYCVVSKELPS